MSLQCRICKSFKTHETFWAKEMLTGSREAFEYFICSNCNTIQICIPPADMGRYYNESYYSLGNNSIVRKNFVARLRDEYALVNKFNPIGKLLNFFYPIYPEHAVIGSLMKKNSRLLDIGCGNGEFVQQLHSYGFNQVNGIEPYLKETIVIDKDCAITKVSLESVTGKFDIIRMHHVLEHVNDPVQTFAKIFSLLENEGNLVVTIPVSDYIFSAYKESAYLVQAPHHFFLFTIQGISDLAARSGFRVNRVIRNARGISNWIRISELWKRNITEAEAAVMKTPIFTQAELNRFHRIEKQLILAASGDNVTLVLQKQSDIKL